MKKVITHSSRFHADDLFGVATLSLAFDGEIEVTRTRDVTKFAAADIVLDVGGEYDEARDRFDHHQKGGAGAHPEGIPYASFGLVWKKYGPQAVQHAMHAAGHKDMSAEFVKTVADAVEERLVLGVDATDNGKNAFEETGPAQLYEFDDIAGAFGSTWLEANRTQDEGFFELLPFFIGVLRRQIMKSFASEEAKQIVAKTYEASPDKRLLILDKNYPLGSLDEKYPDLLFVVTPDPADGTWKLNTVRSGEETFSSKKLLPESWAGLRDADLAKVTGVPDARFCHNARFVAIAGTLEGIKKMAELALKED